MSRQRSGLGVTTGDDSRASRTAGAAGDADADRVGWTADDLYEIERIVGVESPSRGRWRVRVKWKGYDDITPEPLHVILKTVSDPGILEQISQMQEEYLAAHPAAEEDSTPLPVPTRVQPRREGKQRVYCAPAVYGDVCLQAIVTQQLRDLGRDASMRCAALQMATADHLPYECLLAAATA